MAKPPEGLVTNACYNGKQFSKMETLVGEVTTEVVNSTDRLLIL